MNEPERSEWERLKERHARLEQEMILLSRELHSFEGRFSQPPTPATAPQAEAPAPAPAPKTIEPYKILSKTELPGNIPIPPPPIISTVPTSPKEPGATPVVISEPVYHIPKTVALKGWCKCCGRQLQFEPEALGSTILCPHCHRATLLSSTDSPDAPPPIAPAIPTMAEPPPIPVQLRPAAAARPTLPAKGSFEMRLGTFWLVRIGIVMLLTGLVFFGNYAYQNFIVQLNAGGKVFLLYVASAILLGAGWRLQRKATAESLRNYAQVLFAGGLAALYFTTYAAHHFQNLKIIESPLVDGLLLLGCAGFMVFMADLKKSEVLAVFAVLLAYYTSVITRVGSFTLYSNVVLTAASIFFLLRNRWVGLTFASLLATYVAYAFWRFLGDDGWRWVSPGEGLWQGAWFLMSYWALFTAAVFLSRDQKLLNENRAAFLTANNGAFFTLFLLTMWRVHHGGFWKFSLIYGAVLTALSLAARVRLPEEPVAKNAYLTQGLLLITIGLVTKYSGIHLALMLGAESVILLMLGQQTRNVILRAGACLTAAMAVGWGIDGMKQPDPPAITWGITLGLFMLVNAVLAHRKSKETSAVRAGPGYFTILAMIVWVVVTYDNVSHDNFPIVLAAEGILLTLSIYVLRIPELPIFGQGYIVLSQLFWLAQFADPSRNAPPWWNPAILIGQLLFVSHWWQFQKLLRLPSQSDKALQGVYALAVVGVLYFWVHPLVAAPTWLATTSLLAIGMTVYGIFTRAWFVACFGQIFTALSVGQFIWQLMQDGSGWRLPLTPIGTLILLSLGTIKWFQVRPDASGRYSTPLLQLAMIYRWVALFMSVWWICKYIPERERIWLLALLGLWLFLWSGWQTNREALAASGVYTAVALVLFWLPLTEAQRVYWPNLVVIVVLLAQRQFARRLPERYPVEPGVHSAVIIIGGLSLWLFLTRWVLEKASGFYLTASWSVFALVLFMAGMMLRERVYRWLGLAVLLCSLGRVVIFDVWKLETLYRILSFMALGIVLLVLGFIYNKYQEKIREWL